MLLLWSGVPSSPQVTKAGLGAVDPRSGLGRVRFAALTVAVLAGHAGTPAPSQPTAVRARAVARAITHVAVTRAPVQPTRPAQPIVVRAAPVTQQRRATHSTVLRAPPTFLSTKPVIVLAPRRSRITGTIARAIGAGAAAETEEIPAPPPLAILATRLPVPLTHTIYVRAPLVRLPQVEPIAVLQSRLLKLRPPSPHSLYLRAPLVRPRIQPIVVLQPRQDIRRLRSHVAVVQATGGVIPPPPVVPLSYWQDVRVSRVLTWNTRGVIVANLIDNGDFETDIAGMVAQGGATISRDNAHAHTGSWSLKVVTLNQAFSGVQVQTRANQNFPVTGGVTYTFNAWIYGTSPNQVALSILFLDLGANELGPTVAQTFTLNASFQSCSLSAVAPIGTVIAVLQIETPTAEGVITFWVDTLTFMGLPSSVAIIDTTDTRNIRFDDQNRRNA